MMNGYCVQASLAPLRSSFYEYKVSFMPVSFSLGSETGSCWLLDEDLQSKCVSWPNPNSMGWYPGGFLTCDFSFVPLILQDLCSQNKLHLPELTLVGFCSLNLCLTPETKGLILIFHGATLGYSGAVSTQWWCKQWFMVKWKGLKTGKGSNASKVT